MIDVYIPSMHGPDAARLCAARVRAAATRVPCEIVATLADRGNDVVVLDAACLVPDGWLDRLAACAAREAGAGTISPFSNRSTFAGYPRPQGPNPVPAPETAAELDRHFARENAGASIDLPCGEGSCVYVTQAALHAAGPFDAEDPAAFHERASEGGFRHVLCGDLFIAVADASLLEPAAESAAVLAFREREPTRPFRRRVDVARLRESTRPIVLMVTHRWGGGVERHVQDLARLVGDACEVLCLRPDGPGAVELRWLRAEEDFAAWFDRVQWDEGVALMAALGVDRLHFHHIHELPEEVLALPARLQAPYDVTLHDYFPICPRYHLSPRDGETCAHDPAPCGRCVEQQPAPWGWSLEQWRERFHGFLRDAARVIVPSQDVSARLARYYPDIVPRVWTHPEAPRAAPHVHKIALLGSVSAIKGARLLEACVANAQARNLPLHFHVIGHVDRPMRFFPRAPLTIGGSYEEASLPALLALERPDAILFLSQVPETYSYTLSAAMASGLPIVATAVGAFVERLRTYPAHTLLPAEVEAGAVNDALLAALRPAASRTLTAVPLSR